MSLWEYEACIVGFSRVHGGGEPKAAAPSADEHRERLKRLAG